MGDFGDRSRRDGQAGGGSAAAVQRSPGKRSLVEARYGVQRRQSAPAEAQDDQVHAAAEAGLAQPTSSLPHADRIQAAFGRHDVSGIQAHVGGAATAASEAMGAEAYATGDHVAFRGAPDLHTAAHEAAHVVQQRAGVHLKGGVGQEGDAYERHADEVADAVVAGRSAEQLLDAMSPGAETTAAAGPVQRKTLKQHNLATGLTESGEGDLVSYSSKGKEYSKADGTVLSDRTAALTKAAEHNAAVGARTSGKRWTEDGAFNTTASTLDPFLLKINLTFKNGEKEDEPHSLALIYQHAHLWTGYVTSIEDSSNKATKGGVTMYDRGEGETRDTDAFSNVHDTRPTNQTVSGQTDGDREHNLDAYTKIAGEGARWQCVRKHATNLKNKSLFFVAKDKETVVGVTFIELWKSWKTAFNKAYDIADATVATSIKSGFLQTVAEEPRARTALTSADYDLEAGKTHGT